MLSSAHRLRLSVQTKLLLPFLLLLGLIPGLTLTIINNRALHEFCERNQLVISVAVAAFFGSACVVWFFVWRYTGLIRQLREMAEVVGRGDFSRRISAYSNDEFGDLAETFNRMTADLQKSRFEMEKAAESLESTRARLVQSEKLSTVGQFVAGVAHELNNPLAVVIGFSELLVEGEVDDRMRGHLEMIGKSAQRCHKIVANLLAFARVHPPERKLTRMNSALDEVIELMAYDLNSSNIDVIKDFHAVLPPIKADAHQLQQIFVNIIGNARQAMEGFRPDGRIIVRTRAKDGYVRVEIEDNGPGITPEIRRRIFDPFFTTKPVGKGTGLGLSLVCEIIHDHAGRIDVESEPGEGATFIVELPITAEQPNFGREPVRAPARPLRPAGSSGKMILVIDDEEWILTLARELLGSIGHSVETAQDGEAALAAIDRRHFDVIVTDWKMPRMNGVQFYERLVGAKPQMAERVLFMSGEVIDQSFQEFLRRSEKSCLAKPFPIEDFRDAVEKVMAVA